MCDECCSLKIMTDNASHPVVQIRCTEAWRKHCMHGSCVHEGFKMQMIQRMFGCRNSGIWSLSCLKLSKFSGSKLKLCFLWLSNVFRILLAESFCIICYVIYFSSPLARYNSLQDKHLAGYFGNTKMKKHLIKSGLVSLDLVLFLDAFKILLETIL